MKLKSRRKRLPYRPRFGGSFESHVFNVVKRIYPRLAAQWEFDDLLHEAIVVFLVCRERYQGVVDNPAWFMALFSRSLHNRFVDLQRQAFSYISLDELAEIDEPSTELDVGFYWRMLQELPEDMKDLLRAMGLGDDSVLPAIKRRLREMQGGEPQLS